MYGQAWIHGTFSALLISKGKMLHHIIKRSRDEVLLKAFTEKQHSLFNKSCLRNRKKYVCNYKIKKNSQYLFCSLLVNNFLEMHKVPFYKHLCDHCKVKNTTDYHSPEKCWLFPDTMQNEYRGMSDKVLGTSLPVNTARVFFEETNKINFNKWRKILMQERLS